MKNVGLLCILLIFCSLGVLAQETEKVLEIKDIPYTAKERADLKNPELHQVHDVEVRRERLFGSNEGKKGYQINFYYIEDDTLKANWFFSEAEADFDKLYFQWESDAVSFRFENSKTKENLTYRHSLE